MSPLAGLRALLADPLLRLAAAMLICSGSVAAAIAPYASLIAIDRFRFAPGSYAAILVAAALVAVSSSVVAGILADQRGRRRSIALGLAAVLVSGPALMRFLPSPVSFVIAHAMLLPLAAGLFGQVFALARIATVSRPPAERERLSALIRAAFGLPFITILPLWSLAIDAGVPVIDVYALALAAALCAFALALRAWPEDATLPANPLTGMGFRAGLAEATRPAILARVAALGMASSGIAVYNVILGPLLTGHGHGVGIVGLFMGCVAGLEIPAMMIGASLSARMPKVRVIGLGALVHAGFLLAFAASAAIGPVLLLAFAAGFGAGLLLTVPLGYVQDLLHHRPGAGGALIAVLQFLTSAFGALAFAAGERIGGYPGAAVIGAVVCLAGAGTLLWLDRQRAPALP